MSKEFRNISVAFTVLDYERIRDNGYDLYADDVVEELSDVIEVAIGQWYHHRGHLLLAGEPLL